MSCRDKWISIEVEIVKNTHQFRTWNADARPVVVMTHGDLLKSDNDRLETRIYLGEQLGVPAVDYIFEYSGMHLAHLEKGRWTCS